MTFFWLVNLFSGTFQVTSRAFTSSSSASLPCCTSNSAPRRHGLADGSSLKERGGRHRSRPCLLRHAIASGLFDLAVFYDGERKAGDLPLPHLSADEVIEGVNGRRICQSGLWRP